MRLEPDKSDEIPPRSVNPEDPAGGWPVVLEIRLENFLAIPRRERVDFMALKTRMERIILQMLHSLCELLRQTSLYC